MTHSVSDTRPQVGIAPTGYRLPSATRLGPVRLQVADLGRSLPFYVNLLGLGVLEQTGNGVTLGVPSDGKPLVRLVEYPGANPVPHHGRLGLYHFAILLPDRAHLGRFIRHAAAHGVRMGSADHLVSEAVYLNDPDGLGIEVYADRPRESWAVERGQIVMATEPLDIRSLVEAAGDTLWAGAPSGTTIGHVHLHVGDLGKAAAFYHDGLGFDKVVWTYPGALFLSAGGYHHHLGANTWAARSAPAGPDDARLLEWTIILPDANEVASAARNLEQKGYAVTRNATSWSAPDPWGTSVRVTSEAGM